MRTYKLTEKELILLIGKILKFYDDAMIENYANARRSQNVVERRVMAYLESEQ